MALEYHYLALSNRPLTALDPDPKSELEKEPVPVLHLYPGRISLLRREDPKDTHNVEFMIVSIDIKYAVSHISILIR